MLAAVALVLIAGSPRFQLSASADGGGSIGLGFQLGAAVEADFYLLQFVRFEIEVGGGYVPPAHDWSPANMGFFRTLAGADGVLPLAGVELFAGLASGFLADNFDYGSSVAADWSWNPVLRTRLGLEVRKLQPYILGGTVAYLFSGKPYSELHWVE